eukprot:SAG22_NODE_638_length_8262_cov_4.658826_2_plen_153_part_00
MIDNAAEYNKLMLRWLPLFDMVKVSSEDLAYLYSTEEEKLDLDSIANQWLEAGGLTLLLVTRGAQGTLAYRPGGAKLSVALAPVQVVDTVGAGDSYQGAMLVSLQQKGMLVPGALAGMSNADLEDTLKYAGKVAAITCTRAGADPPRANEVK